MKKLKLFVALLLLSTMILSAFASCTGGENQNDESENESSSQSESESESKTEENETNPSDNIKLEGMYADSIQYANSIKNGVQTYYPNGVKRDSYYVENMDMSAEFGLLTGKGQNLTYLKNKNGGTYVQDTMDVFIRMQNGNTYYASESVNNARANVYRIGYYYYDVRILEQSFYKDPTVITEYDIDERLFPHTHDISKQQLKNGSIRYVVGGNDPYFSCRNGDISFSSQEYDAIQMTIKSENSTGAQLFVVTDRKPNYNDDQSILFNVTNDGEYHTYTIMLSALPDYSGNVIGLRFDLGQTVGELIEIKDVRAVKLKSESPYVLLDRTWHTYSDKLHQELHFVAPEGQGNIDALGMITEISEDTVSKLIIKDKNGMHQSLEGVDWDSAEYVGFDIKDAGIFGYIMPADNSSGTIKVELGDGVYTVTQEAKPANGEIRAPKEVDSTANDFFMGHRIYTDASHDFAEFIKEAEIERDPLVNTQNKDFVKYDALRGAYLYTIGGTGFNAPFFSSWNQHYSTEIKLRSQDDRKVYIRTVSSTGSLENAVLLDSEGLLIPIPLEVSKNFGEGEEPVMNYSDDTYGETLFPLYVSSGEKYSVNVLNLYQNWGKFPIKQLSSIAYYAPYYHLSCGVTETTCIAPWYVRGRTLWTLPDFRSQSAPYWYELEGDKFNDSPQHTNAGVFEIIHYTDAAGNYIASENYHNAIDSSGPIYAEVKMDYISDDGKMKISYNHLELPQTDELRPSYEIKIEILDDISFKNFKEDFAFYSWNTTRTHVGYLNADGEHTEQPYSAEDDVKEYVLGKVGGYFGNFGIDSKDATNLGLVIHSSEIYFGGTKFDGNFVVVEEKEEDSFHLSLDLGEATFKKGDTVTLNIIMTPWGSHLSTDAHNLAYIRETSVIDPYKVTVTKGEVIESVYLPRVKTDDGKSAIFTVSGGVNNAAVRVYGFEKLTAPKIYEKIDGEWVEYTVSSINSPDNVGLKHYYDGYMTYYDGDGTYSYAFTFSMDGVESRTFKMEATEDFEPWPKEVIDSNDPINVYLDPAEIAAKFQSPVPGVGSAVLSDDASYIRIFGDGKNAVEVRIDVFSAINDDPTGQYIFLKYRIPSTTTQNHFEFFASTVNSGPKGTDCIWLNNSYSIHDGEWHVLVLDASTFKPDTFAADSDGMYYARYLSFDIFNTPMRVEDYIDIAYIGMCADLEEFRGLDVNADDKEYILGSNNSRDVYSMTTGELISSGGGSPTPPPVLDDGVTMSKDGSALITAGSAYTLSTVPYLGRIDYINGYGPQLAVGTSYNNKGSNSVEGIATFKYNGTTTSDGHAVISGWNLVHGGVSKYVWSVDGKTWQDATYYNKEKLARAIDEMVNIANNKLGRNDLANYADNSAYQGGTVDDKVSGVAADLTAYAGQTVNVIFAVVPTSAPDTVCILANITGIKVITEAQEEETGGADDEVENPYNDPINYYLDATEMNALVKNSLPLGIGKLELAENGEFLRFYGDGSGTGESFFEVYKSTVKVNTGKYIVIKFRMPAANAERNHLQIFTSTVNSSAVGADSIALHTTAEDKDGEWHVYVIDAASFLPASYVAEKGRYYCRYVRFDVFNTAMSANSYIDVAYIGIGDDLDKIRQLDVNSDVLTLTLVDKNSQKFINVKTGEITDNSDGTNKPKISYVTDASQFIAADNSQGYTVSDSHYFSRVDSINGFGPAGSTTAAYDMGSNDKTGIAYMVYNGNSTADKKLVMAGWTLVKGGVEKYVWSADGGKTWNDVTLVGRSKIDAAYAGLYSYTATKYGSEVDFSDCVANSAYQSTLGKVGGIGADLSAFAGETVSVTFAAVPATDNDSLCILLHVEGVKVAE